MSGKRTKHLKSFNLKRIPGNHIIRFYRDAKSNHPFMSISNIELIHYGHEMTSHPSLKQDGRPRNCYIRFRKNPNPNNKGIKCYYNRAIKRLKNKKTQLGYRLQPRNNWIISLKDLKRLKRIDKRKIKNVRLVKK